MIKQSILACSLAFAGSAAAQEFGLTLTSDNITQHAMLAEGACVSVADLPAGAALKNFCIDFLNVSDYKTLQHDYCDANARAEDELARTDPKTTDADIIRIDEEKETCHQNADTRFAQSAAEVITKHFPQGLAVVIRQP